MTPTEEAPIFRERCLWGGVSLRFPSDVVGITIYVAEAAGFAFLCVVKTASPVDRDVAFIST